MGIPCTRIVVAINWVLLSCSECAVRGVAQPVGGEPAQDPQHHLTDQAQGSLLRPNLLYSDPDPLSHVFSDPEPSPQDPKTIGFVSVLNFSN